MNLERLLILALLGCSGPTDVSNDTDSDDTGSEDTDPAHTDTDDTDDTGARDWCVIPSVTYQYEDATIVDVTEQLLSGTYLTLDLPGTLHVCPGTWYARMLVRANVDVVGHGASPADTILSGGESGTILDVSGKGVALSVTNVTLDRGAGLDLEHNSGGGGVYCDDFAVVTIDNAVFTNNRANDGAGLYATECEVTVSGTTFADNVSEDDGGAFTLWYSNATLTDVTFTRNQGLDGGAFAMFYGTADIRDSVFADNTGTNVAGGAWIFNGTVTIADTTFSGNTNLNGDGGGMLLYGTGTLDNVDFTDNTAPLGGGLFVYYESVVDGTACDFSGNLAEDIYAPNYTAEEGTSYTAGAGATFACAANICTGF